MRPGKVAALGGSTLAVLAAAVASLSLGGSPGADREPVATVSRTTLVLKLVEEGTLTPYESRDIKIKMSEDRQLTVKWVIPNGTTVRRGEKVLELDPSLLDKDLRRVKLEVQTAENDLVKAQEDRNKARLERDFNIRDAEFNLDLAHRDLNKYEEMEGPKYLAENQMKVEKAVTGLEEAKKNIDAARELFKEDLVPEIEVKKSDLAYREAEFNLKSARVELALFVKHTDPINRTRYSNAVKDKDAILRERQSLYKATLAQRESDLTKAEQALEERKEALKKIQEDLPKTVQTAPIDGTINYGSPGNERAVYFGRGGEDELKEGGKVSTSSVLMYIPEPSRMFLALQVDEVDIAKLIPPGAAPAAPEPTQAELAKIDPGSMGQDELGQLFSANPEAAQELAKILGRVEPAKLVGAAADPAKAFAALGPDDKTALRKLLYKLRNPPRMKSFRPLKVKITAPSYPDDPLTGQIEYVAGAAARVGWMEETAKFQAKVKIDGSRAWFRPGMKAKAEVVVEEIPDAVAVPVEALFQQDGKDVVYLAVGGRFESREVKVGKSTGLLVQILAGVAPGDKVALRDPTKK